MEPKDAKNRLSFTGIIERERMLDIHYGTLVPKGAKNNFAQWVSNLFFGAENEGAYQIQIEVTKDMHHGIWQLQKSNEHDF